MTDTGRGSPQDQPEKRPLRVVVGARVEVELVDEFGESEHLAFDIVPDNAADFARGFLGASTPLAQALLGRPAGSVLPYRQGDIQEVRLLSVAPSQRTAEPDAAEKRQAIAQEAVNKAGFDEVVQLALTFSSKWGDYDPEGLADK